MSEEIARKAVALWPIEVRAIGLAARRENIIYRVEAADGRAYALRLHRVGYRTEAELGSELQWLAALAKGGVSVPVPVAARSGRLVETVEGIAIDLLSWLPGRHLGAASEPLRLDDREGTFARIGAELARLHLVSDAWRPPLGFVRPAWDADGLLGEAPVWGRFWESPDLDAASRERLVAVRDKARAELAALAGSLDYGLIHADPIRENVLLDGERVHLIDFDDAGFGFRLFDLATAVIKIQREPDIAALEAALVRGYRSVRPIDAGALPLVLLLRALTYIGWIAPRRDEPGGEERFHRLVGDAMPLVERYLDA